MSITGAMLTSLNVVRMALVDCDCSSRSATRARRRLIGTRCSGRSPRFGRGRAATCGNAALGLRRQAAVARRCRWPLRPMPRRQHVALGDAAVLAGAGHDAGCQVVVGHQLGGGGHGDIRPSAAGRRRRQRLLAPQRLPAQRAMRRRPRAQHRSAGLGFGVDAGDQLFGRHRGAVGARRFRRSRRPTAQALPARLCRFRSRSGFHRRRRRRRPSSSTAAWWLRPRTRTTGGL